MQDDAAYRHLDPCAEFQQALSEGANLCPITTRACRQSAHLLHEDVGSGRH